MKCTRWRIKFFQKLFQRKKKSTHVLHPYDFTFNFEIFSGLLNAVGEGLSFATNYVKEENERKRVSVSASKSSARDKESSRKAAIEQMSISAVPALLPGRVNNRGPPRFTEIPFEAIPLGKTYSNSPHSGDYKLQLIFFC